ncbi:MAG: glycosyltransferase [Alphaproteobacteria bacterium]|nr:MAG: glycosyltransferase [Alphaproteobacteria bacterium]
MTRISPGLEAAPYFHDLRHAVLADPKAGAMGPNIRADGSNLTIAFLSLNRAALSIRLVDSIAKHLVNFAGELLVGDNGSEPDELERLKRHLEESFSYRWRILEFGENHGVAGGRNRMMAEARTDWVMILDNDIYFIANPIGAIQEEIATLGTHFISLPLLNPDRRTFFSNGACLQTVIQDGHPRLTINPVLVPGSPLETDAPDGVPKGAFLCSFLFGGASILNRHTFQRLGGFDDNMLIGFEDIDFSLRLFRAGMKVATSGQRALVHDHPKAETGTDDAYERTRYSRKILYESARYLEDKTGFRIWGDEVENWMRANEEKQGWQGEAHLSEEDGRPPAPGKVRRPRIALVTDTDNWAFANISRQLKRYLSDRFEFEIFPLVDLAEIEKSRWFTNNCAGFYAEGGAAAVGMALLAAEDFDIVHVFWREFLTVVDTPLLEDYAKRLGMTYPAFRRRFIEAQTLSTSVYDHLFLDQAAMRGRKRIYNDLVSAYYVSSPRLACIYRAIPDIPDPAAVLPDGVDLTLFRPRNLERFDDIADRSVRIGWVGHSGWADTIEDFKGVKTILKPAIEQLQAEGLPIEAHFADREERHIPHREMPDYYAGIDVLVCTSKIEGTPNPVLEAMACGVPVITTDVGIVPNVLGERQKAFVLEERSVECLKDAIRRLVSEPALFGALSEENLESIAPWDWSVRAEAFGPYFEGLLAKRRLETGEAETRMCLLPFSSPSMEPDGAIRLCSASSIFEHYDETNMGNCLKEGMAAVWKGNAYRAVRRGLLTGEGLKPYCAKCEYRHAGPAWALQLHLALHAWHHGVRSADILALIGRRMARYGEYEALAPSLGLPALALPEELRLAADQAFREQEAESRGALPEQVAPEPLLDCGALPLYMDFNTLNRCNVTCIMCPPAIRHDMQGVKRDPYYRLTLEEYRKITDGMDIRTAHFVGAYAEPLLNKELFDLIAHAKSQGTFTAITTNGMALGHFAEKLLDSGLDMMTLSLHGATKETAEAVMMRSDFHRILANVRKLQALKKERGLDRPSIHVNYVTQKCNAHEMPAFVDLAAELGVDLVNFIHLIDGDEAVNRDDNLIRHPDLLIPNLLEAKRRAEKLGVNITISPAYDDLLAAHGAEPKEHTAGEETATA